MLPFLTVLLTCQLAGTALQEALAIPVPGPVIGMVLLFLGLVLRRRLPEGLESTSRGLLEHLSLLFVPAGVGVMQEIGLIQREWLPISVSLVGSAVITIAVTALVMQGLLRLREGSVAETRTEKRS